VELGVAHFDTRFTIFGNVFSAPKRSVLQQQQDSSDNSDAIVETVSSVRMERFHTQEQSEILLG
jgi:hypothetical protein